MPYPLHPTRLWLCGLWILGACTFGDFTPDAGITDAGRDAAILDGAVVDAAPVDAAPVDAAPVDASGPDAANPDAQVFDAGPHSIGALDIGLSTLVGDSSAGLVNGPREFALFDNPVNVLVAPSGDVLVADFNNSAIRKVSPSGDTVTLTRQPGFSRPFGMVIGADGKFFVQTDRNSTGAQTGALYEVALDTGVATLRVDDSGRVRGMGALSDGRIVLANPFDHTLRIYDPDDDSIVLLAGAANTPARVDATGAAARFNRPSDVVVTSSDEIFVSDSFNHRIRKVTLAGVVTTVAGNGAAGSTDDVAINASFNQPTGLALRDDATLYICEFGSGHLRQMAGGMVTTIAGSTRGFADNSDPLLGQLNVCEGIDYVAPYLYLSDGNGGSSDAFHRVRRLDLTP